MIEKGFPYFSVGPPSVTLMQPPWIIKWRGLERSVQRLISLYSKTKRKTYPLPTVESKKNKMIHSFRFLKQKNKKKKEEKKNIYIGGSTALLNPAASRAD